MHFGIFNLMSYRDNPGGISGIVEDTRSMVRLAEDVASRSPGSPSTISPTIRSASRR
ncbi:hypothetical protein [Methylobrevis pamukkalensis]|uniref:hypothetical protein n=1 Tax=Methylobrevis pamukkalensis TaxID=1439726 RepID=UPI001FD961CA|nr:hypothetical protein [Methylobrevis pamukkalensis]